MTKFAVTATAKIAKIPVKTTPVPLLFTRRPRRIKSEDEFLFSTGIFCDSTKNIINYKGKNICPDCIKKLKEKV